VIVGALVQFGKHSLVVSILAGVAIVLASINIVGGFAVTRRMLAMFTTDPKAAQ
jgi:NAD(P) transhydrogenase subunit alpha